MKKQILNTDNSKTTILIRLIVGVVFLLEGIQKFLFADTLNAGRFDKIGLPSPEFLRSFKIICGTLILFGFSTKFASIPLFIIMLTAITATKSEILAEKVFGEMKHESRTDWAMLLGNIFILIKGGGYWSGDKALTKNGE